LGIVPCFVLQIADNQRLGFFGSQARNPLKLAEITLLFL
jgi:hypothetical protein